MRKQAEVGDRVIVYGGGKYAGKSGRYVGDDVVRAASTRTYRLVVLDEGPQVRVNAVVVADPEHCCDRGPRTAPPERQWHDIFCPIGKGAMHHRVVERWAQITDVAAMPGTTIPRAATAKKVLDHLRAPGYEPCTAKEIGEALGLRTGSVAAALLRMANHGLTRPAGVTLNGGKTWEASS